MGPHGAVGLRGDSKLTVVEAELAVVIGVGGRVVGYTVGNDMSAWDIERENPLFLPQSKIFQGSFGFGPVIATPASIPDPHALTIRCVIERGGRTLFEGRASTGDLKRRVGELVDWLGRYNPVPPGTVLSTGTGILVPDAARPGAGRCRDDHDRRDRDAPEPRPSPRLTARASGAGAGRRAPDASHKRAEHLQDALAGESVRQRVRMGVEAV